MLRLHLLLLLIALCLVTQEVRAQGSTGISSKERREAEFALEGMWASIQDLRSGRFQAKEISRSAEDQVVRSAEYDYWVAFDFDKEWIRFDQEEAAGAFGKRTTKFARNEAEVLTSVALGDDVRSVSVHDRDHDARLLGAHPFDVRIAGLSPLGPYSVRDTLDRLLEKDRAFDVSALIDYERDRDAVKLTFEIEGKKAFAGWRFRRELWIDKAQGYKPIRAEVFSIEAGAAEWVRQDVSRTEWLQMGGTWVPKVWRMEAPPAQISSELTFDWESVNEPIPERLFQIEGFEAPDGTAVMDYTLDTPIKVATVGETPMAPLIRPADSSRRMWLLLLNLALVAVIGASLWRKYRVARG